MELTKKKSFIKQIMLYLKNNDSQKAYDLAKEFVGKFPDEMTSHFLLSKAAYESGEYEEAKVEGRKAFNMSHVYEDMLAAALMASTAYMKTKEYAKGFGLLKEIEKKGTSEELQLALLTFSLALRDEKEAFDHMEKLYALNEKLAMDLAQRMIEA